MEGLVVVEIENQTHLDALEDDWKAVYYADPKSHIYISWLWFQGWVKQTQSNWNVLAVKDIATNSYIGFFPLSVHENTLAGVSLLRKINFGGKPYSIYAGFLCLPDYEPHAIEAIATFMQNKLEWDVFHMNWIKDNRIELFARSFPVSKYVVNMKDDLMSLSVNLPNSYQEFLTRNMGKSTRKRTLEKIKHVNKKDQYRITVANHKSIKKDVDILCNLWNERWKREDEKEWHRHITLHFFRNNMLRLNILWDLDKPIAALASIPDPVKKTCYGYITSYNPDYSKLSPGIIMFIDSIKYAIENNYQVYDLAVGLDFYKLSFGSEEAKTKNVHIQRKRFKTFLLLKLMDFRKRIVSF